ARSMDAYRPTIERLFAAADIPVAPAATPLPQEPVVRFLLDAAALPGEFAFRDVLRVIKSSYFLPESLGEFDATTVAAAEMIIRQGNVLSGRDSYAHAARRLARPRQQEADDDEASATGTAAFSPETLAAAGAMLAGLFDAADKAADPPGLLELMRALQLPRAACRHDRPERIARDLRALAALEDALADLPPPWPTMPRLREALGALSGARALSPSPVQLVDVLEARPLRARHVFLLGVGEGQFPPRFSDSAVLGEAQRIAWASRGVTLDSRGDLATREMLLFYLAVSRADESLTVSYLEPEGGGLGASHFLESLTERIAGPEKPPFHRVRPGWPVPTGADGRLDESQIVSPREAVLAAAAGVFSRDFHGGKAALAWSAMNAREELTRAAMGIFARDRRWRRGGADAFDGRLDREDLLAALAGRFGPEHVFSASGLSLLASCPWSFFARYVLALEPLVQPERQLEAQSRGIFVHDVLFHALSSLAGAGGVDLAAVSAEECGAALERAVAEQAARVESRRPPYPGLWRVQLEQMRRELADFLTAQRASALPGRCLHFELAFGPDDHPEGGRDPASTPEP
ncbi:MAG: PD-(D/E)XK nuclease family protein, partial [Planctomycetota bacterium]|nr:PD-(D/E)XK nuclease family protein [Planctomycetota bacterium]